MAEIQRIPYRIREPQADAEIETGWLGYKVYLTHDEVHQIAEAGVAASTIIPEPTIAAVVQAVAVGLVAICALGGHGGVTLLGTWLAPFSPLILPGRHL